MEALRVLHTSNRTPRRTVRVVLFTGEKYGLAGARAYRQRYGATLDKIRPEDLRRNAAAIALLAYLLAEQ